MKLLSIIFFSCFAAAQAAPMIINSFPIKKAKTIISETSRDADSDAVRKYINFCKNSLFRDADIMNAETPEQQAEASAQIHQNLFILYGTTDKPVITELLNDAGVKILPDGAAINGRQYKCKDLRIIFIWKHQYYPGHGIIYAARSNKLIPDINSLMHGPKSLYLYDGDKLVYSGYYDINMRAMDSTITVEQAYADIRQLFSELEATHPNLLAKLTPDAYLALQEQTFSAVLDKLDNSKHISVRDLAYILYYAAAHIQDGHTSLYWRIPANELAGTQNLFPPFILDYINGKYLISQTDISSLSGKELVKLDGKPVPEFIAPILDRCSAEAAPFKNMRFTGMQDFWWAFSGILNKPFTATVRDTSGKTATVKLKPVGFEEFSELSKTSQKPASSGGTRVEYISDDKIARFIYPEFRFSAVEKNKINDIFKEIKAKGIRDLIIDLRGNNGGNSLMGNHILSFLTKEPYSSFSKVEVRISKKLVDSYPYYRKYAALAGLTVVQKDDIDKDSVLPVPDAFFTGRTYLLTDNNTFSSATDFVVIARDYGLAKIIGYETGGLPICFGDLLNGKLDNSGIQYGVSFKKFYNPKPRPGDDEHGVIPDYPVTDAILERYKNSTDPVLDYAVNEVIKPAAH